METRTYYLIQVYFTDTDGNFRSHIVNSHTEDLAREWKNLYESHIGKRYYSTYWDGVIDSVFVFKAHLCDL